MEISVICPVGTDLASRRSAALLRASVNELLDNNVVVKIDLSNVQSISESYADELFGILVLEHGLGFFANNVSIECNEHGVLKYVVKAIKERLTYDQTSILRGLVIAKSGHNRFHRL